MDFGKAFTFVFEDDDWIVKILLAAAILLLGILFSWVLLIPLILALLLLGGYSVEITRRVIQGDPNTLPEWDNWGDMFVDGLKVFVIGIVWGLPTIIVGMCFGFMIAVLGESAEGFTAFLSFLLSCFNIVWAIVMSITLPAAIGHFVANDDLSAAFRFGEVLGLVRDNFVTYLLTFIMSWVAGLIGSLGALLCFVGWFVTIPYASFVTGHLYGQAYVEATGGTVVAVVEEVDVFEEID
jgi:hypothetical protein